MINLLAISITLILIGYLFFRKKSLLDFRVFTLVYFLFFYQLSFYSYYFIEQKIDFSFVDIIGPINMLVVLGYVFASLFLKMDIFRYYKHTHYYTYSQKREIAITWLIFIFLLFLLAIYYMRAGTFPIFLDSIEDGRIELASNVSGFVIVLLQFVFVLYVLLMAKLFYKQQYFLAFLVLLSTIGFWLVMASKRPIAGLLLMFLIFYIYQKRRIKNRYIIISLLMILSLVVVYGSFRLFGTFEVDNMLKILTAIFNAEMFNLALVLNDPPPLQYGATYLNSILMIFTDVKDIGTVLKEYYGLTFMGGGITIGIIGEGWINFSYVGVFIEAFLFWLIIIVLAQKIEVASEQMDYFSIGKYIFYFYFLLWVLRNGFFAAITPMLYVVVFEVLTRLVRQRVTFV
jgi:oligosaccharide repeat unit polymerase